MYRFNDDVGVNCGWFYKGIVVYIKLGVMDIKRLFLCEMLILYLCVLFIMEKCIRLYFFFVFYKELVCVNFVIFLINCLVFWKWINLL